MKNDKYSFELGENTFNFRLTLGSVKAIQADANISFGAFLKRISTGEWFVEDINRILFYGIKGAGVDNIDEINRQLSVMQNLLPFDDLVNHALQIVVAFTSGVEIDPVGKPQAAKKEKETDTSPSLASMELALRSVIDQKTSTL